MPDLFVAVLRRRGAWTGWWPVRVPGLWRRTRWLWWTWDRVPGGVGRQIGELVDDLHDSGGRG